MEVSGLGIAGEVRLVVTGENGEIREDTGYHKNLILDQGLEFLGGNHGTHINSSCVIGSGNSTPTVTQTKLDSFLAIVSGDSQTSDHSYTDTGDGLYRFWEQKRYRFSGLADVNVSELGLASQGNASNYYLTTRVLVKDSMGEPTSISIRTGETLDIYYKIHKVVDVKDREFVVNVVGSDGESEAYNITMRPSLVGNSNWKVASIQYRTTGAAVSTEDLKPITGMTKETIKSASTQHEPYISGSHKKRVNIEFSLNSGNIGGIRTIGVHGVMYDLYNLQMRIGKVSDDSPLLKTSNQIMTIPLEYSWGRYEGEL